MAYTPELSRTHSGALRRIAWAMEIPMTKAMVEIFEIVGDALDNDKICSACRDRSFCNDCLFKKNGGEKLNI
jgi:hypothetical protein